MLVMKESQKLIKRHYDSINESEGGSWQSTEGGKLIKKQQLPHRGFELRTRGAGSTEGATHVFIEIDE